MYDNFTEKLKYAKEYTQLGLSVFPCHTIEDGRCSCGNVKCTSPAKHPLTANGVKDATQDVATLERYFSGVNAIANIAVATGEASGVWVLDVDDTEALVAIEHANAPLPRTWTVATPSGGRHYYFRHDERCENFKNAVKFAGALDVRTTGGYVLLPPSLHATGNRYRWLISPHESEVASAPDWLVGLVPKRDDNATYHVQRAKTLTERAALYLQATPPAVSGERGHDHTFSVVCRCVELFGGFGGLSDDELLEALSAWNERCEPPWTEKELRHKITSARKRTGTVVPQVSSDDTEWPTLDDTALYGLAGEIVKAIEPQTEADIAGVLVSLLVAFGNAVGKRPHFNVGAGTHHANLFACLVGDTASGKGLAWDVADYLLRRADNAWRENIAYGLSSGEGLIERVGDGEAEDGKILVPVERRLLCVETEFAKPITAMRREGNTLSPLLRSAWDGNTLEVLTRSKTKLRASNAHVGVMAHITPDELASLLAKGTETTNGFVNRFLWCVVRSCKSLPHGGDASVLDVYVDRLRSVLEYSRTIDVMRRSKEADKLWENVYPSLKASKPGAYGKATERARAQTLRLSMLYALLDSSPIIQTQHLDAALAVWRYCDDSASRLFGTGELSNTLAVRLLDVVRQRPGLLKSELRHSVSHTIKTEAFDAALGELVGRGEIVCVPVFEGRQAERYYPGVPSTQDAGRRDVGTQGNESENGKGGANGAKMSYVPTSLCPKQNATENVPAASLADVFDWRNRNSVSFVRRSDGGIWVTPDKEPLLTPAIASGIRQHADVLVALVSPSDYVYGDGEFVAELDAALQTLA